MMKIWQVTCVLVAITIIAVCQPLVAKRLFGSAPSMTAEAETTASVSIAEPQAEAGQTIVPEVTQARRLSAAPVVLPPSAFSPREFAYESDRQFGAAPAAPAPAEVKVAGLEGGDFSMRDAAASGEAAPTQKLSYLAYYVYSELPPEKRPADIVLESLKNVPQGTPVEEIKRAADAFGLDFNFMRTVAKIESDFDPKNRTGQYIGLFQLSKAEFNKYGSGEITNARDNAVAAAYKFVNEATLFELDTHKNPTPSDLYLIHQQGWQGASEHVQHPERVAWQSMCATDEGKEKGERWCRRAIWGNTLPAIKRTWGSVEKLTSAAFVEMWRDRVDSLYARYSALTQK
jgi:hypothetical protein